MAISTKLSHDDYTVAWICALPLEMAAAKVMLDEVHGSLSQPSTDHNNYTLGRRAGHNVVVACLPSGVYGTTSAATVLSQMLPTFPRLRFGLMVGIGGGVPREDTDIRLGDVVYDFGKTLRNGRFQRIGTLNKPPHDHMIGKRPIARILSDTFREHQEMKEQFSRPDRDWLFEPMYTHEAGPDCSQCDQTRLVKRVLRENQDPYPHYGLIASGNQVIKDAARRDALSQEMDILCFEMEAAGLMDQFPCLVIRGICDYCDSHKNKQWQGYSALAAAAYAKAFLELIPKHDEKPEFRPTKKEDERHWMVPFHKNLRFVGREAEIAKIEELMNSPPSKVAICGLGGVGKTQIALETAYRMREREFNSIFWVPCTSHESVEQAYMSIAQKLGIHGVKATEAKSKVKAYLSQEEAGKWLLIFDNADSLDMWSRSTVVGSTPLTDYLPRHEQGHILFTTRNRKSLIDKTLLNDGGEAVALELLEQLAFLPLAINQAAAYINENSIDFSDYIELLQDQESKVIELLSEDFGDDWRYNEIQNPVATTWLISFQQVRQLNQLAADYLLFMACINPRDIAKSLLPETVSKKKSTDAVGLLKAFSFINEQGGRLSLHRLVHLSTRNWLRTQSRFRQQLSKTALRFEEVFPTHTYTNRAIWREYLPHVLSLISEVGFPKEEYLSLVRRVGWCLNADGRFNEAALLFEDILEIQRSLHGETDIETTVCAMGNLALVYCYQGRWTEAEKLQTPVLEIRKEKLGPDHSMTLETMNNMALAYEGLGKYKEAEEIWAQLLETDKRMQGPEHQLTINSMHNLTNTYTEVGRLTEAEELGLQVVEISKRVLGPEHPDTLGSIALLSSIYKKLGNLNKAEEFGTAVVEASNRVLGPEHPDTLIRMHNLAWNYVDLEKLSEAEELQWRLVENSNRVLGPEHPDTLNRVSYLAEIYSRLGKWDEVKKIEERALAQYRKAYGREHPKTLASMEGLARAYRNLEQWKEAEALVAQLLEIHKRVSGPEDPETLGTSGKLAQVYQKLDKWEEAEAIQVPLLETYRMVSGLEDKGTMNCMHNLARTWKHLGRLDESIALFEECINLSNNVLGPEHRITEQRVPLYWVECPQ
ncbi:uncharacterized protein BDW70DRAFT_165606 [Aspergillus foveolatus]|uniref:uncharacterized protein n=1 Tax=Aspergillus foveolatus TaxID=210207 RepID=UPI003CCD928C